MTQSRDIIGYTTSAGHRLSSSRDGGNGLCILIGLLEAMRQFYDLKCQHNIIIGGRRDFKRVFEPVLLIRGDSIYHRFARFNLLCY